MTTNTGAIEALQKAFRSMPVGSRSGACPEPERLWAAVRLEISADQRREVIRHIATCAACAEDWRVTWKLWQEQRAAHAENPPRAAVIQGPWKRLYEALPQVAAAALVVLAVGIGGFLFHQPPESTFRGTERGPRDAAAVEGEVTVTPDGASLPRAEFVLRWTPTPGATYDVTVMTEAGDFLETASELEVAELRIPPEKLEGVPSGGLVLWQVEVVTPEDGATQLETARAYVE